MSASGARETTSIALRQVHFRAVDVVGHKGAALAAFLPARGEHEVLHQELAAAFEQAGERAPARQRIEGIVLLDAHPRQRAAFPGDLVAQARQLLLARQQRLALGNPLVSGHDAMVHGARLGNGGVHAVLLGSKSRSRFVDTAGPAALARA
jgi:hypothetical protein